MLKPIDQTETIRKLMIKENQVLNEKIAPHLGRKLSDNERKKIVKILTSFVSLDKILVTISIMENLKNPNEIYSAFRNGIIPIVICLVLAKDFDESLLLEFLPHPESCNDYYSEYPLEMYAKKMLDISSDEIESDNEIFFVRYAPSICSTSSSLSLHQKYTQHIGIEFSEIEQQLVLKHLGALIDEKYLLEIMIKITNKQCVSIIGDNNYGLALAVCHAAANHIQNEFINSPLPFSEDRKHIKQSTEENMGVEEKESFDTSIEIEELQNPVLIFSVDIMNHENNAICYKKRQRDEVESKKTRKFNPANE